MHFINILSQLSLLFYCYYSSILRHLTTFNQVSLFWTPCFYQACSKHVCIIMIIIWQHILTSLGSLYPGFYLVWIWLQKTTIRRGKGTHDAILQTDKFLLFLLPLLKVNVDQCLELQKVLLHSLPVDVLKDSGMEDLKHNVIWSSVVFFPTIKYDHHYDYTRKTSFQKRVQKVLKLCFHVVTVTLKVVEGVFHFVYQHPPPPALLPQTHHCVAGLVKTWRL